MKLKKGQRIELVSMDDPEPVMIGESGTVVSSTEHDFGNGDKWSQVVVDWDCGRSLMLAIPPDRVRVLPEGE